MKFSKLPALALLASLAVVPLLTSCAWHRHQPAVPEPGAAAPDTSVTAPEPLPITPPPPPLIAAPVAPPAPATVNAALPAPPPSPLPFLKLYQARAREAFNDGVYQETADQLRNAAELMDQVIVTSPRYTLSQPWLVNARNVLHHLADEANRGELDSSAAMERAFARAFRAVARHQADLARPAAQPADEPPPPWIIP